MGTPESLRLPDRPHGRSRFAARGCPTSGPGGGGGGLGLSLSVARGAWQVRRAIADGAGTRMRPRAWTPRPDVHKKSRISSVSPQHSSANPRHRARTKDRLLPLGPRDFPAGRSAHTAQQPRFPGRRGERALPLQRPETLHHPARRITVRSIVPLSASRLPQDDISPKWTCLGRGPDPL